MQQKHHIGTTQQRAHGFVLAITLWLLAGMAVIAAVIALWSFDQVREAGEARSRTGSRQAMMETRDTLLYLMSTTVMNRGGMPPSPFEEATLATRRLDEFGAFDLTPSSGEIRLDGSIYQGVEGIRFALQDEAGLMSLSWVQDQQLDAFLLANGVDADLVPRLRDQLQDYVDEDELRRLHGAEKDEYRRLGLPPPANRRLLVPTELERIPAWQELDPALRQQIVAQSTTAYSGAINLNTIRFELASALLPGCPKTCETFLALREQQPFLTGYDMELRVGVRLPGDSLIDYRFAPSDAHQLTLWGPAGAAWRIHVRLTPLENQRAPWIISSAYSVPRPNSHDAPRPTGSPLFPDPAVGRP